MFKMEVRTTEDEINAVNETCGAQLLNGTAACDAFPFFTDESLDHAYHYLLDSQIHIKYQPIGGMAVIIEAMRRKYGISNNDATLLHTMAAFVGKSNFNAETLECIASGAYGMAQRSIEPDQKNNNPKFSDCLGQFDQASVVDLDGGGNIVNATPLFEEKVDPAEVARRVELIRAADKASYNKVMDENFPKLQPWLRMHLDPHIDAKDAKPLPGMSMRTIPFKMFDVPPLQFFSIGDEVYAMNSASIYLKVFVQTVKKFPGLDAELYIDMANTSVCNDDELVEHVNSINYHILRLFESYGGRNKYIKAFYRALCDEIAGTSISI